MSDKVDLRVDWCSYQAAKYAVEHWHYSKCMPAGKTVKIGAWENDTFIGCVIFSFGTNKSINRNFGLDDFRAVELTRIALQNHVSPVSKIASIGIRMLKSSSSELRLIISYADPLHSHNGAIYQAMNWVYIGTSDNDPRCRSYRKNGVLFPWRSVSAELMRRKVICNVSGAMSIGYEPMELLQKHKYLYPLDKAMRKQIEPLRKPYPKCERGEIDSAPGTNQEIGGASPTRSLLES